MGVIDADAHVIETEQTWSFMREEDRRFAPELLVSTKNGVEYWRIDERVYANSNLGLNVPEDARDLTNVDSRVAHMDSLGIDIQVLYPSLFLRPLTARAETELALCRGYNRWLAEIWKLGKDRLRWVVIPPLLCSLSTKRPNGSTYPFAFMPAREISAITISLARMYFRASSFLRWAHSIT